jgi:hypothetical protein
MLDNLAFDVVMVMRLDRLARSTRDLLNHSRGGHRHDFPVDAATSALTPKIRR